ncbi:hypothetical protein [Streptomyces sp. NPDC002265]|uniref:WXG100 family type VII secretion target n=1 Tax=Streptomyces sp. NPDC002265 TaxID=3154415 RepID=UPI0033291D7F
MPEYGDYDIGVLSMDPQALDGVGDKLIALAGEMADSIIRINDTVSGLSLGWVAESADEAQAFGDRWNRVMAQMFGDDGVLTALAGGIKAAAIGSSQAEVAREAAFRSFSEALASTSGGGGGGPQDHTGPEFPITQDFPN